MTDEAPDLQSIRDTAGKKTASPLTDAERRAAMDARKKKLSSVLESWETESKELRTMRRNYAYALLFVMFCQAAAMHVSFFFIGFGQMKVDEWTARVFVISVFTELAAMVFFVVKYLFSRTDSEILTLIERL